MEVYDLCLAWEWQYDTDFVRLLETAFTEHRLSLLQLTPQNTDLIIPAIMDRRIRFRAFWDRASDADPWLARLLDWVRDHRAYHINQHKYARQSWNKAFVHRILTAAGLCMPRTIALPSFQEEPDLQPVDLAWLGQAFSIKPAHGGGGRGVVNGATCWQQVLEARLAFPHDQYLLQAQVVPSTLCNRPAWFRVIHCCQAVFPCWWDPDTHIYLPVTPHEMEELQLYPLVSMVGQVAEVCRMEVFSSEIARTEDGSFVMIDYINDPIDLRMQSSVLGGVPNAIAEAIANRIAASVAAWCEDNRSPENCFPQSSRAFPIYIQQEASPTR